MLNRNVAYYRLLGPEEQALVVRYASIDLNDEDIVGGSEETLSMTINWYVNDNMRMLFDWTHIVDTDESNQVRIGAVGMDIFWARAQFTF